VAAPNRPESRCLIDAHLHLQDAGLVAALEKGALEGRGIAVQLVNGTSPDDWAAVQQLEGAPHRLVLKAYGVHPWKAGPELPDDWDSVLESYLQSGAASVGEIGLDNWIEPRDEERQERVFARQLEIAHALDLTPTLHCLRAWGRLYDLLRSGPSFSRGFLVHGFGGSVEMLHQLADLGGHFSFSAYASDPKRKRMRDAIRACPSDRLLAETDAPDMVPPPDACCFPLSGSDGRRMHHPAEIRSAYHLLAGLRGMELPELIPMIEDNFRRLFGHRHSDKAVTGP